MERDYLSLLNAEQKAAVEHSGSPLLILAGAGSGKTRVITTKIAYLIQEKGIDAHSILAVTFTKKAATEMKERAVLLEPTSEQSVIRTFHSFGSWFLRRYASEVGLESSFTVFDDDDMVSLISSAMPALSKKQAGVAAHGISLAKDYFLGPEDDLSMIDASGDLNEIYAAYQKKLLINGNVDFGDLIMLPAKILNQNERIASQMHYRFKVVMVDEYQDSNVAQFKLLRTLVGPETYVCVVGDDDQSIYKFRGAEVQNILNFPNEFAGTQIIRLETNYRSTGKILACADAVVRHNEGRLGKTLVADRGEGTKPVLTFLDNQDDEADYCANLIKKSVQDKKSSYGDWAILYRTNAQATFFETLFKRRKIPYQIVGSITFFEREEIRDILAYLELIANPRNEVAFKRIVNKPTRGVGEKSQEKIIKASQETFGGLIEELNLVNFARDFIPNLAKKAGEGLREFCSKMEEFRTLLEKQSSSKKDNIIEENAIPSVPNEEESLAFFIKKVVEDSGLFEYHQGRDEIEGTFRTEFLMQFVDMAKNYQANLLGLVNFLDSIELDRSVAEGEAEEKEDGVTLITLHNTKGLEFPKVIITGVENGIFPREDKVGDELEEERRIFYVGITRAKDELYITSCKERRLYGRTEVMMPSKFLIEAGDVFYVFGKQPAAYRYAGKTDTRFENEFELPVGANKISKNAISPDELEDELGGNAGLKAKYSKGTKIYHSDWGYGQIIACEDESGEYVVNVKFETGATKKFMPEYQSSSLEIIKD